MKKLIFAILMIVPSAAFAETLGWQAIGASNSYWSADKLSTISISTITPSETAVLNKIHIYGYNNGSTAGEYVYCRLYSDNEGYPGNMLTVNWSTGTMPTTAGWFETDGDMNYELPVSTRVHVVYRVSGTNAMRLFYDTGISGQNTCSQDSLTWNSPLVNNNKIDGRRVTAYLEYTAPGVGTHPAAFPEILIFD